MVKGGAYNNLAAALLKLETHQNSGASDCKQELQQVQSKFPSADSSVCFSTVHNRF